MNHKEETEYPEGDGKKEEDFNQRGFYIRDGEDTGTHDYEEPPKLAIIFLKIFCFNTKHNCIFSVQKNI